MAGIRRLRFWQKNMEETSLGDALARAAATGERVEKLVELTARSLLAEGAGDRAAVWLRSEKEAGRMEGIVVEASFGRLQESSHSFDATHPAMAEMLESREPALVNLREVAWGVLSGGPGALAGMKTAAVLPLACGEESLGVALVAYAAQPMPDALELLEGIADLLAVTVSQRRHAARSQRLDEQLSALVGLERSLTAREPVAGTLKRLAELAKKIVGASFVAIARRSGVGNGISFAAFDGPAEIHAHLGEAELSPIWRAASRNRRAAVENFHPVPEDGQWGAPLRRQGTDQILVLPLEAGAELQGVMAVGLGAGKSPPAVRESLEPLAAVVAQALCDDFRRVTAEATAATLSALLESGSGMVLLLDAEGYTQEASRAAREKLGLFMLNEETPRLENIFPERERLHVTAWSEAVRRGVFPAPVEVTLEDGTILRLRLQAARLPEGRWHVELEDLTSARSAERHSREVDAELAAVLDSMESGMLLFDTQGRLCLANARFAHLLGLEPQRLREIRDFEELLGAVRDRFPEPRAVERRWREIVGHGEEAAWDELEVLYPSRRVVERFARPVVGSDGERIGWLELYRDITGERLIQSKLLQAEKMAALGQLVSGIAHELNNPLTGIMGYAQLLLRRPLEGQGADEVRRIFEEAERAGRIVKNLLLFAREKKPERKPVDLNEVIERGLALRSYELKVENITIERQLDPELPPALGDAHQLQQVVLNLVVNAEQAIQQGRGSGRITVRTRRTSPQRVALEVSDDGPGIPPEIATRIFDPFFTTKPVGVGTGLGLSIVYGIVHEHGGSVTVDTRPGRGTGFVIDLPAAVAERRSEERAEVKPRELRTPSRATGRKILVIEDEPTVAQLVVDVLREEGHEAEALLDSVEALERLLVHSYDLVVCDLRMPRLDGRDLYQSLVRSGNSARQKIIFITGDTLTAQTAEFLERNSLRCLAKPFLVEELKRVVEEVLENGRPVQDRSEGPWRSPGMPHLVVNPAPKQDRIARGNERFPGRVADETEGRDKDSRSR
jgi:signal transduction histidine kinase/DNA-binding NarL/FixJ family response regulator